jgi:ubiquinone/menaquinone biosynthesis C-methylase UbiE
MKKDNPKNLWNKSAEAWVDFVRTGKDYDREELNNPAMFKMLGNIKGKKILDLACGDGYQKSNFKNNLSFGRPESYSLSENYF